MQKKVQGINIQYKEDLSSYDIIYPDGDIISVNDASTLKTGNYKSVLEDFSEIYYKAYYNKDNILCNGIFYKNVQIDSGTCQEGEVGNVLFEVLYDNYYFEIKPISDEKGNNYTYQYYLKHFSRNNNATTTLCSYDVQLDKGLIPRSIDLYQNLFIHYEQCFFKSSEDRIGIYELQKSNLVINTKPSNGGLVKEFIIGTNLVICHNGNELSISRLVKDKNKYELDFSEFFMLSKANFIELEKEGDLDILVGYGPRRGKLWTYKLQSKDYINFS